MAKVGAQRAAALTGRSKSTVQRAMNTGRLSYEVDPNGRRLIDVSELDRAFGLAPNGPDDMEAQTVQNEIEKATNALELERLRMRIRMLEDQHEAAQSQIGDLREQRDQWQRQAQQVLLTSQYSQKQAEEYKEKLDQQQRQSALRRQQAEALQQRRSAPVAAIAPAPAKISEPETETAPAPRGFHGFLSKLRGQNGNQADDAIAARTAA